MDITGKKIVVVGLGKSGIAAAKLALAKGALVYACDSAAGLPWKNELKALTTAGAQVELGVTPDETGLADADIVIISPGVAHDKPAFLRAAQNGVEIIGELEFAARYVKTPLIAITGTNGKTTTTELCAAMLKQSGFKVFTGGNIGTPLAEYAVTAQTANVCVVEVSSFQLDTIVNFSARVAVALNVTPDHLDRYAGDIEKYGRAKMRIFENQTARDYAVLNINDKFLREFNYNYKAQRLWFGNVAQYAGSAGLGVQLPAQNSMRFVFSDNSVELDISKFKLLGPHNRENLAAAALAALAFGAKPKALEQALANFAVSPHRVALIAQKGGVRFIDDSKATNIDAVARALDCVEGECVLIMGGLDKGCDFEGLRPSLKGKVRAIVAIGAAKPKIKAVFGDITQVVEADSMQDAVTKAYALAKPNASVLLSPACASFDMFNSYAHRGEEFIKAVNNLALDQF